MNILKYRRTLSFSLVAVFGAALAAPVAAVASESGRRNTALALGAAALVLATKKNKTPALAAAVGAAVAYKRYNDEKNERQDYEQWRRDRYGRYDDNRYDRRYDDSRYDSRRDNDQRRYDVFSYDGWDNRDYNNSSRRYNTYSDRDRYGNAYSSRDRYNEWASGTVGYKDRSAARCDADRYDNRYRATQIGPPHGDYQGYYRNSRGDWVKKPVSVNRDRRPDNRNDRDHSDKNNRGRYDYKVAERR